MSIPRLIGPGRRRVGGRRQRPPQRGLRIRIWGVLSVTEIDPMALPPGCPQRHQQIFRGDRGQRSHGILVFQGWGGTRRGFAQIGVNCGKGRAEVGIGGLVIQRHR